MKSNSEAENKALNLEFTNKVDAWVLNAWDQKARNFNSVLAELPGVYPSEVLRSLRRLKSRSVITDIELSQIERDLTCPRELIALISNVNGNPIEHPLDYEWRFTRSAVKRICDEIISLNLKENSHILCLGCPSVYMLGKQFLDNYILDLWDKNGGLFGQIAETSKLLSMDLSKSVPVSDEIADVAVIDPPWYLDFCRVFLWAAYSSISIGGHIMLSFPPSGTRPTAENDYNEILAFCSKLGLKYQKRIKNYLAYRSPLFEVNALRAEGIINYPFDWRKGDLIVFKKESAKIAERPIDKVSLEGWSDLYIGSSRIKICNQIFGCGDLISVGESEVLPTVSSQCKLRGFANVVTSGNRFLKTARPKELTECLTQIDNDLDILKADCLKKSKMSLLLRKTIELICKEQIESADYFARTHEM